MGRNPRDTLDTISFIPSLLPPSSMAILEARRLVEAESLSMSS
jgi:hypothetical protein